MKIKFKFTGWLGGFFAMNGRPSERAPATGGAGGEAVGPFAVVGVPVS